jgi:hypothetical protein
MANVCAYQFVLRPRKGQSSRECLDAVRDEMADWICELYRAVGMGGVALPFDGTCLAPHPTHELWSDQRECTTHRLATIEWVWPEGEDPTLSWVLAFSAACDDRAVQVDLLIQIVSRPFLVRPWCFVLNERNPLSYLPGLATRLLRLWPGEIGGWTIPTQARTLRASAIESFLRETLHHPGRVLPVVVLNLASGRLNVPEGGLQSAQDRLLGQAQVVALANKSALKRLVASLANETDWGDAQARIYWPRLPCDEYPIPNALLAEEMSQALQRMSLDQFLLGKFLEFSAGRYREGELIRAARLTVDRERAAWRQVAGTAEGEVESARAAARQAQEERDRLRQECDTARQLVRSLQGDLAALRETSSGSSASAGNIDELAAELERTWDENRRLTASLEADQQEIAQLRAELQTHRENWSLFASARSIEGKAPAMPEAEREFATVADALQAAADNFADVLMVWEDARRSAASSPFPSPVKVYRALESIGEVGRSYFQAKEGGPPLGPVERAFACRVPFKYTGFESQTTLRLYGAERVFHHDGQSRQMQRHLTLGGGDTNNCLQIYFDFDDDSRRVLIGHCGRHLPYHRQRT